MLLALLAPALNMQFFVTLVCVIAALAIVYWVLQKVSVPAPFNYVLYAIVAVIALWFLFTLVQ